MAAATQGAELQKKLEFKEKLTELIHLIHSAQDVAEIIVNARARMLDLLDAERVTIYAVDAKNQQVYSLYKEGDGIKEIRLPRNYQSLVGFVAMAGQTLNIKNAYDAAELGRYHPELRFDGSWDKKTGFKTKQVVVTPILHEKYLMGVLQLINKRHAEVFSPEDVAGTQEVAKSIGLAFYNRRRLNAARRPNKFGHVLDTGLISEQKFEEAVSHCRMNNLPVAQVLIDKYGVAKEEVLKSLSAFYQSGYFLYDGNQRMPEDLRERLKLDYLTNMCIAPISKDGESVQVAMEDPTDLAKADALRIMQLSPKMTFLVALPKDILDYLNASYKASPAEAQGNVSDILGELNAEVEGVAGEDEEGGGSRVGENDSAVVRLANQIIMDAYKKGVSDIHVEPYGKKDPTRIRFRLDGDCYVYQEIPPSHRQALVSRLKIMSNLDISERRLPQDGKIRFKMGEKAIELRVATIPTVGGEEDVVMRILAASKPLPIDQMGFLERNLRVLKEMVEKPYGICLCVGPTGSGKTTTLHSMLGYINKPDTKIWTAEDPVEITQPGLRQVQVQPKIEFTFSRAMRAFLRADPDVIMVGEMRDKETAEIGIEASLTGHLVMSTLHTNSAPETITRLLEMEIEPFNFADALLGILAQRLARRICKSCKVDHHPTKEEFDQLVRQYDERYFELTGIKYTPELTIKKAKEGGCPDCGGSGYRGRVGLHEILLGTDPIKRLIQKRATVEEIRNQAISDGMTTLMQDGIQKIFQGITDLDQVRSVCIK